VVINPPKRKTVDYQAIAPVPAFRVVAFLRGKLQVFICRNRWDYLMAGVATATHA